MTFFRRNLKNFSNLPTPFFNELDMGKKYKNNNSSYLETQTFKWYNIFGVILKKFKNRLKKKIFHTYSLNFVLIPCKYQFLMQLTLKIFPAILIGYCNYCNSACLFQNIKIYIYVQARAAHIF